MRNIKPLSPYEEACSGQNHVLLEAAIRETVYEDIPSFSEVASKFFKREYYELSSETPQLVSVVSTILTALKATESVAEKDAKTKKHIEEMAQALNTTKEVLRGFHSQGREFFNVVTASTLFVDTVLLLKDQQDTAKKGTIAQLLEAGVKKAKKAEQDSVATALKALDAGLPRLQQFRLEYKELYPQVVKKQREVIASYKVLERAHKHIEKINALEHHMFGHSKAVKPMHTAYAELKKAVKTQDIINPDDYKDTMREAEKIACELLHISYPYKRKGNLARFVPQKPKGLLHKIFIGSKKHTA